MVIYLLNYLLCELWFVFFFLFRQDYHQVNETDPYLPPPQASQAIAARTLQRSQGSSYPPDTPPPSYTSALMHNRQHATAPPLHEADLLLYIHAYFLFFIIFLCSFIFAPPFVFSRFAIA